MSSHQSFASKRVNVLTLDGGGVRGLSALLILERLMMYINLSICEQSSPRTKPGEDILPHQIFDLVAGTSTGGLIAIMLGKLGMTVTQCIDAYRDLSERVFGHMHFRGRVTGGLAHARYSGSNMQTCIEGLVELHRGDKELLMAEHKQDKIACAVICREHETRKYSDYKANAVCICSLACPDGISCRVFEAARATSAAPTYFPVQQIGDRFFADGGLGCNNPTFEIHQHYTRPYSVIESHRLSMAYDSPILETINNLKSCQVRFVNLGTGTVPEDMSTYRTEGRFKWGKQFIPGTIRMAVFLKKGLAKIATDAERVAKIMKSYEDFSSGHLIIKYERFSEDRGVCFIKMNKYKRLADIERLTKDYLDRDNTTTSLRRLARSIARDYLAKLSEEAQIDNNNRLAIPSISRRVELPLMSEQSLNDTDSTQSDSQALLEGVEKVGTAMTSINSSPTQKVLPDDSTISQTDIPVDTADEKLNPLVI